MIVQDTGSELILTSIADNAKSEAETLITDAEKLAAERISYARQKADMIIAAAREEAATKAAQSKNAALSTKNITLKRERLQFQGQVVDTVVEAVNKKIGQLTETPEYRAIIAGLIMEAVVNLDSGSMYINATGRERNLIDTRLVAKIQSEVRKVTGTPVVLKLSDEPPLRQQGIIVTSDNRRVAYNNLIITRIRRFDRSIRNRIHEVLFTGNVDDPQPPLPTETL